MSKGQPSLFIWSLASSLALLYFLLQADTGLSFLDEGFLWYGIGQVGQGEVPMLDFRSYAPGRYYWGAFWAFFFGDSLVGVRLGLTILLAIGLGLGLLAVRRVVHTKLGLIAAALLLLTWIWPWYQLFGAVLTMAAVYVATRLIETPSPRQYFLSGVCVGLAGCFARNHGLYTLVAFFLVTLWNYRHGTFLLLRSYLLRFLFGSLVGACPLLLLALIVPDFFPALVDSLISIIQRGTTNFSLPVPWPWTIDWAAPNLLKNGHQALVGLAFTSVCFYFFFVLTSLFYYRFATSSYSPLLVAATCVGLPYAHHMSVRSDFGHLVHAIHPILLGTIAFCSHMRQRRPHVPRLIYVCLVGLTAAPLAVQPAVARLIQPGKYVQIEIARDILWIKRAQAQQIEAIRTIIEPTLGHEDTIFFAPSLTTMYPIFGRPSPVWDVCPIWPATTKRAARMLAELQSSQPLWAVINNTALDGKEPFRFRNTHPVVWKYLHTAYEIVRDPRFPENWVVFKRSTKGAV